MNKILRTLVILATIGTLFAGSVTARQYIRPTDVPGIFSCVGLSIWGLSPCPYGLALFMLILIVAVILLTGKIEIQKGLPYLRISTVGGVLFSGWVVWRELGVPALTLGAYYWQTFSVARVPACAWGFIVFLAVAILSFVLKSTKNNPNP